jgi:hypothetical protein
MREVTLRQNHGAPLSFRELCMRVVPDGARYLVLDLDRTVHFGINLGERLGWEFSAYQSYGADALDRLEPTRGRRLLVLDFQQPVALARFLYRGVRRWAYPGMDYLVWGKLASSVPVLRRMARGRYGEQFMQRAQRGTQLTLMRHLAEASEALQLKLAQRVWERAADDQVITREDLAWLRARHPGLRVILTSASPRPMVEVAAAQLGVDLKVSSTLARINSGTTKIDSLRELCPEVLDPAVISVGVTDNHYGEDLCWADHFTSVVDINGAWPFPHLVTESSPCRAVHSAAVLTQAELRRRASGDRDYLDPRRASR